LWNPKKNLVEKLKSNYINSNGLYFENSAIYSESLGNNRSTLYKLNFGNMGWVSALSSFDKEIIQKHINHGWVINRAKEQGVKIPLNRKDWIIEENVNI
jgi:hypothetical protein